MAEMDNLPFDLSNLSREDMDRMMSDYNSDATDISPLFTEGGARAAAQGLTFGTGDEIEAAIRSMMDQGLSFNDALNQVQGKINQFSEENPNIALGAEIAGAIPTMFMAAPRALQIVSNSPLGATALGAGGGFAYGFAKGEGLDDRMQKGIEEGVFTALGSGAVGTALKTAQRVNPYVSPFLRRLKNKVFGGGSVMDDMKTDSIKSLRQYGRADRPQAERDATGALSLFKEPISSQTDTPLTRKQLDELIYGKFDPMTAAENARLMEMQNPVGNYDE